MIITPKEAAREALQRAKDQIVQLGKAACRPIYRSSDGEPEHVGSGTFISINEKDYFLTAAHVLDKVGGESFFVGQDTTLPINLTVHSTTAPDGNRELDKRDFAFAQVGDFWRDQGIVPLQFDLLRQFHTPLYSAFGWPCAKNRKRSINSQANTIRPTCRQFLSNEIGLSDALAKEGFSNEHHLVMHRPKFSEIDGVKVKTFEPRGMSGGVIFGIGKAHKATVLAGVEEAVVFPAAIVIEKHLPGEALIGVRLSTIARAISQQAY